MSVRVTEAHEVTWNHVRVRLAAGDVVPGGPLASYLIEGGAPVEPVEAAGSEQQPEAEPAKPKRQRKAAPRKAAAAEPEPAALEPAAD